MMKSMLLLASLSLAACAPQPVPGGCSESDPTGPDCSPKQFCGGIAGIPCPGSGACVDDPSDSCDPNHGGADCGGMCVCNVRALCIKGYEFDASPAVCACVPADPCATVRCAAGTHCEATDGRASCVPDVNPCAATLCQEGSMCVPVNGEGVCVPNTPQPCGKATCAVGQVCCNASCGICTPPGGACIQIACE